MYLYQPLQRLACPGSSSTLGCPGQGSGVLACGVLPVTACLLACLAPTRSPNLGPSPPSRPPHPAPPHKQTLVELSDGSAVAVTVAKYQTPAGVDINKASSQLGLF